MSATHEILQLGHPVLRLVAEAIPDIDATNVRETIALMKASLAATQGVGLAAPQIGISKRIVIVASRPTPRYPHAPMMEPTVMINPAFQPLSSTLKKDWEGCLSIPGIRALVPRYTEIRISYLDEQGQSQESQLEGFVARVFQHEFDHLDGLVYLDRVANNRDIVSENEYLKLVP